MPLETEPTLLSGQGQALETPGQLDEKQRSFDVENEIQPDELADEPSSGGNCFDALIETASLVCTIPGYWRVAICSMTITISGSLPGMYTAVIQQQVWGTHAASWGSYLNAVQFSVAVFGAPLFGMWSDGRPRKTSLIILTMATLIKLVPYLGQGWLLNDHVLQWWNVVITILISPFISGASGSPVLWAYLTDVTPAEKREIGFAFAFIVATLGSWITGTAVNAIRNAFGLTGEINIYVGVLILLIQLLTVISIPRQAPPAAANSDDEEDPDPLSRQKGLGTMMLSPFKLVARKRSLRLICGMTAFVTLPDIAVTNTASFLVFPMVNATTEAEQLDVTNWLLSFPNIFLVFVFFFVGVCSKRYGPARFLTVWLPITSVMFAAPALLQWLRGPFWECFAGVFLLAPLSMYAPLQALVALLVPSARIGEAMGAVAAFKNLASLIAPLVMAVVTSNLSIDLYWTLFPICAVIMLAGAWPFSIALAKRLGNDTNVQWSVWSSVGGSSIRRASSVGVSSRSGSRA